MTYTTEDLYRDLLIGAVEGGTGYWAQVSEYRPDECTVMLKDIYDTDSSNANYKVDDEVIKRGIRLVSEGGILNNALTEIIRMNDPEALALHADAEVADCIVQVGLFGELVYG